MENKEFLATIIRGIVDEPEKVMVESRVDKMGVLLIVKCSEKDAGVVIGKEGKVAQAIKLIMRRFGIKNKERIAIRFDIPKK